MVLVSIEESPPDFHVRVAGPADHAQVVALLEELFDEIAPPEDRASCKQALGPDIAQALASPDARLFLAEHQGQLIALVRVDVLSNTAAFRLRADRRCGYIDQMVVRPAWRRRAVGRQLMQLCEGWLRQQGVSHCMLHAAPKALSFYTRAGYQSTRELFKKL